MDGVPSLLMQSSYPIRLAHVGVMIPPVGFGMIAMKAIVLGWCERTITIRRRHGGLGEDPVELGTRVPEVRVVHRRDGAHEGIISVPKSVFIFLLVRGTPDGISDMLKLRRWLRSKVRPNLATMRPHDWFVVLGTPLRRGRQRPSRGNGLEGHASGFCIACVADSSFGKILFTQWAILIQVNVQNFVVALLRSGFFGGMLSFPLFKTDEHRARGQDYRANFIPTGSLDGGVKKFVNCALNYEMRICRWPTDGLLSRRGKRRMVTTQMGKPRDPLLRRYREIVTEDG